MQDRYYVLIVYNDVEPALRGPFNTIDERDDMARLFKRHYGDEHGIFALEADKDGLLSVESYSGGFFTQDRCTRCGEVKYDVFERYSYGVYAGRLCTQCCYGYKDHCGIDQPQGDPAELEAMGETY